MMSNEAPAKKSLGQHWLRDPETLQSIAAAAEVSTSDTILEVGPGLGTLTEVLVKQAAEVCAVEFDHDLALQLPGRVQAHNLSVEEADILDYDLGKLPPNYKVVANIPYYLTSHLIRRLLEAENQPSKIVLLIQKEVAERIVAGPGQMSILAVAAQFYADCELGLVVPADLFEPPPKVDSQLVIITPKQAPNVDTSQFFRIVKAGFGEKRKKLTNSLAGGLQLDKALVMDAVQALELGENTRAQELGLDQWLALYERLKDAS